MRGMLGGAAWPRDGGPGRAARRVLGAALAALVLVAAAVPWLAGLSQAYQLRTAAWQLAGQLRLTRQKAISSLRRHRLVFTGAGAMPRAPAYRVERLEGRVWVAERGAPPTELPRVELDVASAFRGDGVTFDERGRVAAGGSIRVRNAAGTYAIRVDPRGRVGVCACRGGACC